MNRDQKRLAKMMAEFAGSHEDRKAEKAARKARRTERRAAPRQRIRVNQTDDWDAIETEESPRGATTRAATQPVAATSAELGETLSTALVTGLAPGRAELRFDDHSERSAEIDRTLGETSQTSIAVGDRARVVERAPDRWRVVGIEPRRSKLSRSDPSLPGRERVIAANVDLGVVVCAARRPPPRPGLVDRYWAALVRGGITPLLVVNKIDQLEAGAARDELEGWLTLYRDLGLTVLECSAHDGRGLDELRARLTGRIGVLVGHSGVGKSSLVGALVPASQPEIGAIRPAREGASGTGGRGAGRGRHTTTGSALIELPGGGCLIDTPGIRVFGLHGLAPDELYATFPEIEAAAASCRFADCRHDREPDCGVQRAAAEGAISAARFGSFRRLYDETGTETTG